MCAVAAAVLPLIPATEGVILGGGGGVDVPGSEYMKRSPESRILKLS
jgi:hypothetical protein